MITFTKPVNPYHSNFTKPVNPNHSNFSLPYIFQYVYDISYVPNFNNFLWCLTCVNMMMLSPDKVCVRLIWLRSLYLPSYWKARAKLSSNKSFSQAGFKPIYHQLIKLNPKVFINFHGKCRLFLQCYQVSKMLFFVIKNFYWI